MKFHVKLEVYEGPVDLLLRLLEREEVTVASVSVCEIIDQFIDYLAKTDFGDLEEGSRFLVTMATLLSVKAQLVLPRKEHDVSDECLKVEENDGIDVDFEPEAEYLIIKEAAALLEKRAEEWRLFYRRPALPLKEETSPKVKRLDVSLLVSAFKEVLKRSIPPEPYRVQAPSLDIWEKIDTVMNMLAHKPGGILFREMFSPNSSKEDLIVTFLAILELVYQGKIRVKQEIPSGDIYLAPTCQEKCS